jgi:hypothetical protein
MMAADVAGPILETGVSLGGRIFAGICGVALFSWTLRKLSKRELLIPISSLNLAVGLGLAAFALVPSVFDQLSLAVGIKYPPLLYMMLAMLTVLVLVLFLSAQLSIVDGRCRRLAEEAAMLRNEIALLKTVAQSGPQELPLRAYATVAGRTQADRS